MLHYSFTFAQYNKYRKEKGEILMKRILLASAAVAIMGIGAVSVYADSTVTNEFDQGSGHMMNENSFIRTRGKQDSDIFTEEERQIHFDERQAERAEYREERIQLALDEGWITEEEATERRAEYAERDRVYEENGFSSRGYHHGDMRKENRQGRAYGCH